MSEKAGFLEPVKKLTMDSEGGEVKTHSGLIVSVRERLLDEMRGPPHQMGVQERWRRRLGGAAG